GKLAAWRDGLGNGAAKLRAVGMSCGGAGGSSTATAPHVPGVAAVITRNWSIPDATPRETVSVLRSPEIAKVSFSPAPVNSMPRLASPPGYVTHGMPTTASAESRLAER